MLVVRPAERGDIDPLFDLIQLSESGLSTLKISKPMLTERVDESVRAFAKPSARPAGQPYVFVMIDLPNQALVGTAAVYSKVGGFEPYYTYEIKVESKRSPMAGVAREVPYLSLHITHDGPTEIGSLFLSPDYWGGGQGRLLSLSRFMFMAEFADRFERETIAELRGIVCPDGYSPVWNAIGAHFFEIEYPRAETLTLESKKFIAELIPQHPIYIPLLPEDAREAIGQVHKKSRPALKLLEQEGFEILNFVDIFDGGPTVHCQTAEIRSIRDSRVVTVARIDEQVAGDDHLVSNRELQFRCVNATVGKLPDGQITLHPKTAGTLGVGVGQQVRIVLTRPAK